MAVFDTPQEAFGVLRPVCVQLTKAQTVENVERLQSQLQVVSDSALQELQEYVLFPLRFALKTPGPKRERVVQSLVQCLTFVLSTTCVKKPDLLLELFSELCVSLASPSALSQLAPCSEEVKQAVVQALLVLLHSANGDVILSLYQPSNLPQLGFAVSLLLSMVEQEKAKQLKLSALKCLQALFLECDCPKYHRPLEEGERRQCGDLLASFLPGLSITLSQVITADVKQGHALVVSALRLFSRAISLVMADEQLAQVPPEREKPALEPQSKIAELMVHRGPGWAQSTAAKLSVLVRKVVAFVSIHPHWKARQALVETACLLMSKCSRSLAESVGQLLKALVSLVNDERPDLQRQSKEALKSIAAQGTVAGNRLLADVFSEDLHSLATALPRLLNSQDDQGKASTLNLLLGYVKLLGPAVNRVLTSASHLQRLSRALMQVLELEVNDVKVVEERRWGSEALREPDGPPLAHSWGSSWQGKHFRFFTEERIVLLLQQICRALGYYGNIYLLVDHFMELYRESASYRKQAAMVVNELIAGAAGLDVDILHERDTGLSTENLREVVASVVDEYVDEANWHLVTTSMETQEAAGEPFGKPSGLLAIPPGASGQPFLSSETRPTIHSMSSNIWQICIQLEGIGRFGQALQEDFRLLLISVLYPVLEKAGGDTLLISQAARRAMVDISRACGYTSLPELINQNADYLVDGISLHLRHQAHEAQAMRVLEAMLRHSDAKVLPLVEDVVQDTLARLDQCYHERVSSFLCAMQTLMTVIASWSGVGHPAKKDLEPEGGFSLGSPLAQPRPTPEAMEEFFQAYVRQKRVAEGDLLEEEEEEEDGSKEEPLPAPEPEADALAGPGEIQLPFHARTAKAVMERCTHLLSAESLRVRLQVLDILEVCIMVLSPHEDLLLPLAHQAWPPLTCRLTHDDPLAVLRAFRVLCTLGAHSGDFLRRRFSKDVLPKLAGSLVSQAPVSARAGPIYSHTLAFKLQLAVLQGLGSLCKTLDLGESDLDKVMEASLPYLSAKQPGRLQEAACSVFLHLMQMDPDALWFFLGSLWCPHAYVPPHHSLAPVKLEGMEKKRNEFSDNVQRLLDTLQERESGSP